MQKITSFGFFLILASIRVVLPEIALAGSIVAFEDQSISISSFENQETHLIRFCTHDKLCEVFPSREASAYGFTGTSSQWKHFFLDHCAHFNEINILTKVSPTMAWSLVLWPLLPYWGVSSLGGKALVQGSTAVSLGAVIPKPYPDINDVLLTTAEEKVQLILHSSKKYYAPPEVIYSYGTLLRACSEDFLQTLEHQRLSDKTRDTERSKREFVDQNYRSSKKRSGEELEFSILEAELYEQRTMTRLKALTSREIFIESVEAYLQDLKAPE